MKDRERVWLLYHRDQWRDEIPETILDGSLPDDEKMYKCRKNWFCGVRGKIEWIFSSEGKSLAEAPEIIRAFLDWTGTEEFFLRLTTEEDIALGNRVINYLLENY